MLSTKVCTLVGEASVALRRQGDQINQTPRSEELDCRPLPSAE